VARQPRRVSNAARSPERASLPESRPVPEICLELTDHSRTERSAADLFLLRAGGDLTHQAARLADQFITQNRPIFELFGVSAQREFDGTAVRLVLDSSNQVGAAPLISPFTARPDYGLVIHPRFPWPGIGPILAETGWRVCPTPLRLPLLKRSARKVPPWVLSVMVLARLKALLETLERRFEQTLEERRAPKGKVLWEHYAARSMPRGRFLAVPCSYSDLHEDRRLKGAIRFTLERQLRSLETQREAGAFVHRLIDLAESLLQRVRLAPARRPGALDFLAWRHLPVHRPAVLEGLEAIEWTVEERGLAGASDLEGVPWRMSMEEFFEAWVEVVFRAVLVRTGGRLRVGRLQQTAAALAWDPPYAGSQRSLVPDLVVELEGATLIVDAKYKRHFEELEQAGWGRLEEEIREEHRRDLLQVLAYAHLADAPVVGACLVYPCTTATWESLRMRQRLFHQAAVPSGWRSIWLGLTAVPMETPLGPVADALADQIRRWLRAPG